MNKKRVTQLAKNLNNLQTLSDGCRDVDDCIQLLADKMQAMLVRHKSRWQLDYDLHIMQWYALEV